MSDITVNAAYGSVVEDEGFVFVGFAEGEEEDESYVLFRQSVDGGPIWFEVNDESFGAEEAVEKIVSGPKGLEIALKPESAAKFGWANSVAVRIGPTTEDTDEAYAVLADMFGPRWQA